MPVLKTKNSQLDSVAFFLKSSRSMRTNMPNSTMQMARKAVMVYKPKSSPAGAIKPLTCARMSALRFRSFSAGTVFPSQPKCLSTPSTASRPPVGAVDRARGFRGLVLAPGRNTLVVKGESGTVDLQTLRFSR